MSREAEAPRSGGGMRAAFSVPSASWPLLCGSQLWREAVRLRETRTGRQAIVGLVQPQGRWAVACMGASRPRHAGAVGEGLTGRDERLGRRLNHVAPDGVLLATLWLWTSSKRSGIWWWTTSM